MLITSHFEWAKEATMLRVIQAMVTWRHKAPLAGSDGYLPPTAFCSGGLRAVFDPNEEEGKSLAEPFDVSRAHQAAVAQFCNH